MNGRPAVFFDRDGTLIEDRQYIAAPDQVQLVEGAAETVSRLRKAGYTIVVVTNQSGLARGIITPTQYEAVAQRVDALLGAVGALPDATYMCPHHPDFTGACECRKPGAALFRQATQELDIDLSRSVLIGDRWRDIEPAHVLSARGILVPTPDTGAQDLFRAHDEMGVATTLSAAADRILGH